MNFYRDLVYSLTYWGLFHAAARVPALGCSQEYCNVCPTSFAEDICIWNQITVWIHL